MSFMFLFGFGWRIDAGVKHLIPGIGSLMTILASGRTALLAMTSHAQPMVCTLQTGLVLMVPFNIILKYPKVIGTETIHGVTVVAGNLSGRPAVGMTSRASAIGRRPAGRVMVAQRAVIAHHINVRGMIENNRFIQRGKLVKNSFIRGIVGQGYSKGK